MFIPLADFNVGAVLEALTLSRPPFACEADLQNVFDGYEHPHTFTGGRMAVNVPLSEEPVTVGSPPAGSSYTQTILLSVQRLQAVLGSLWAHFARATLLARNSQKQLRNVCLP